MKATDDNTRNNIITAKERGEKVQNIAQWLNISKRTVDRVWKRYKETGSYSAMPYTGRKSKISKEQDDEIVKVLKEIADITLEELIEKLSLPLCISGLWLKLKKMGYTYKKRHYILMPKIAPMCKNNEENGKNNR